MPFTTNTPIQDAELKKAINAALEKDDTYNPTINDLVSLTRLDAANTEITDLTGLEYAVNLTILNLSTNDITDITPVQGLNSLTYLNLFSNDVQSLEPIKDLTNLTALNLGNNRNISDKSIIGNLTNLTTLILINTQTSDIAFLKDLTELTSLNISQNTITNITPLKNMEKLKALYAFGNNIQDISSLEPLKNIMELNLNNNNIRDIAALERHTSLNSLQLSDNQIIDLSPIGAFVDNLMTFKVENQQISLPERAVVKGSTKFGMANPIIAPNGETLDEITPNDGTYDQNSKTISWEGLNDSVTERTFTFGDPNSAFSGEVTQPIKWVDAEVTLPLNDETEVAGGQIVKVDETGTQLMLPEDLPSGTTLKVIDVSGENYVTGAEGLDIAGPVLEFIFKYPDGQNFTGNFTLTMGYNDDATDADIYYYNDQTKSWEPQKGTVDSSTQTITINPEHFSVYGVFAESPTGEPGSGDPSTGEPGTTPEPGDPEFDPCDSQDPIAAGCPEDQLKDDDDDKGETTVTVEDDDKTSPKGKGFLPKTATEMYNYLLVGSLLLISGVGTAIYMRRRKRVTK